MKKIIVPEDITIHFGLKFSYLKNLSVTVRNNLSNYTYRHLYRFAHNLQFSIVSVNSESSPQYTGGDTLLAISVKKIEDVSPVYQIISQEIQRLDTALRYCSPEKLTIMGESFKEREFPLEIDKTIEEIKIKNLYDKMNIKLKEKSAIKSHKI